MSPLDFRYSHALQFYISSRGQFLRSSHFSNIHVENLKSPRGYFLFSTWASFISSEVSFDPSEEFFLPYVENKNSPPGYFEISTWKSLFPDTAPYRYVPNSKLLLRPNLHSEGVHRCTAKRVTRCSDARLVSSRRVSVSTASLSPHGTRPHCISVPPRHPPPLCPVGTHDLCVRCRTKVTASWP